MKLFFRPRGRRRDRLDRVLEGIDRIEAKIMALKQDFETKIAELATAVSGVAGDVQFLKEKLAAGGGLSQADGEELLASLGGHVSTLQGVDAGTDPSAG